MNNLSVKQSDFTYVKQATVLDIHDGDTITVAIKIKKTRMKSQDIGYHIHVEGGWITIHTPIRFYGINAPELKTPEGIVARDFLKTQLAVGNEIKLTTALNPSDKYGRWLGIVEYNGVNLNNLMVSTGHAVVFDIVL